MRPDRGTNLERLVPLPTAGGECLVDPSAVEAVAPAPGDNGRCLLLLHGGTLAVNLPIRSALARLARKAAVLPSPALYREGR